MVEWNRSYEELLFTKPNQGPSNERSFITSNKTIKFKCVDCGKEVIAKVASLRSFHGKILQGKKDPCQDDLLCKGCKVKRLYRKKFGVNSPQMIEDVSKKNKETFFKNHPNYTPYSPDPIEINSSWEEFLSEGRSYRTDQKIKYKCTDCGKEVIITYGTLRSRKKFGINSGFYCKSCSIKHYYDFTDANNLLSFKGNTLEDLKTFKKENNLTIDHSIKCICPICHKVFILRIRNFFKRQSEFFNYCDDCYMEKRLNDLSALGSAAEVLIYKFLVQRGFNVRRHVRDIISPLEIDLYIEDLKIGIEYNGYYWHSRKDKYYHQNKALKCRNKGIRLIQFYEKNWKIEEIFDFLDDVISCKENKNKKILSLDLDNTIGIEGKITEPKWHEDSKYWDSGELIT